MKYFINIIIIVQITLLTGAEIDIFTCINAALDSSLEISNSRLELENIRDEKSRICMELIPQMELYSQLRYDIDGNRIGINGFYIKGELAFGDDRIVNIRKLHYQKLNVQTESQNYVRDEVIHIISLYTDVISGQRELEYYRNMKSLYENETAYLRGMTQGGNNSGFDLAAAELELRYYELRIEEVRNELEAAILELNQETGLSLQTEDSYREPLIVCDDIYQSSEITSAPELLVQGNVLKQSRLMMSLYRKALYPGFFLSAYYGWEIARYWEDSDKLYDFEGNYITRDQMRNYWEVSLNLNYPLGELAKNITEYRIASRKVQKEMNKYKYIENFLTRDIEKGRIDLIIRKKQIELDMDKAELVRQKSELAKARFHAGLISFLDFHDSNNELLEICLDLLDSRFSFLVKLAEWQKLRGERIFNRY